MKRLDRAGALLAVATYCIACVFGWALVGTLIALWWGP